MRWPSPLLFSFLNPLHEDMLREALERPDTGKVPFLSISSRVLPEYREYERTSTVVVNAYVAPVMAQYLANLQTALGKGLRVMQSSGGSITASLAAQQPVRTVLSGPAGGVVGAFHTGSLASHKDIITLDMGGTSTDVSLCPGRIRESTSSVLGGYPISVPMIEIHTVGAGGGSIARVDEGGALQVGPESAGAEPGPACYGKGVHVTVTDANLVLGRLQAGHFFGRSIDPGPGACWQAPRRSGQGHRHQRTGRSPRNHQSGEQQHGAGHKNDIHGAGLRPQGLHFGALRGRGSHARL